MLALDPAAAIGCAAPACAGGFHHTIPPVAPAYDVHTGGPYQAPPIPYGEYTKDYLGHVHGAVGLARGTAGGLFGKLGGLFHRGKGGACGHCGGAGCGSCDGSAHGLGGDGCDGGHHGGGLRHKAHAVLGLPRTALGTAYGFVGKVFHHGDIEYFVGPGGPVPITPGYVPYVVPTRSPRDFLSFPPYNPNDP